MRIIYLFTSPSLKGSSVQNKVLSQIEYLKNAGSDCRGAFFSSEVKEITLLNEFVDLIPVEKCTWKYFRKIGQKRNSNKSIYDFVKNNFVSTDLFYLRYPGASRGLFNIVKSFGNKIVTEHQSKEIDEIRTQSKNNPFGFRPKKLLSWLQFSKIPLYYEKVYGPKIRKNIKATVSVTSEIGDYQKSIGSCESIVVLNGINTSNYKIRNISSPEEPYKIKILYLKGGSTDVPWSGLERLINAIEKTQLKEDLFELVIAGKPEYIFEKYSFINQIGYIKEPLLTELINDVHIGVNHLGLHRIGLNESSNLKVREYFSRGLPFINASIDQDIIGNEFVLDIPNNDETVNMDIVFNFVQKVLSDPAHPQKMRKYAEEHLDYKVKMKKLYQELLKL